MQILPGIVIVGKALWIEKLKILVVADLHIGYEEALAEEGYLLPRTMFKEMSKELKELLEKLKPSLVVINGDLKHEFGQISKQEWFETNTILDMILERSKVVLIKGNHDTILEPIARRKNLEIKDFYIVDGICILHGHKIFVDKEIYDKKIKILIIGHEHPAISIREGLRKETYKCFLLGRWKDKKLIVMPSFFTLYEGSDIKKEELLSPYLNEKSIKNFEVFVVADKIYRFGKVKDIR